MPLSPTLKNDRSINRTVNQTFLEDRFDSLKAQQIFTRMKPSGPRVVNRDDRLRVWKAQAEQVDKHMFVMQFKQVNDHLMRAGKSMLYPKLSRKITRKLVSKCNGDCVLTLQQKEARHCLHRAEARERSNEKQESSSSIELRRFIHQVDLAMKLVSSPLHHTQDTGGGPLTKEEQKMSYFEDYLIIEAMSKMPPGLKRCLHYELTEQFGPSSEVFVRQLLTNITMHLFMPWHKYLPEQYHHVHLNYIYAYSPTMKDLFKDLICKFHIFGASRAVDVVKALVKQLKLAFLEAASTEDKLAIGMHKMSLADGFENAST